MKTDNKNVGYQVLATVTLPIIAILVFTFIIISFL